MQGLRGNVLEQAAQIAAARFASPYGLASPRALQLEVEPGDPIRGSLQWNSGDIPQGIAMMSGYLLGQVQGEDFYFATFTIGGVTYAYGTRLTLTSPAPKSARTDIITSYAMDFGQTVTLDALCFLASGTLATHSSTVNHGSRVIGLRADQINALTFYAGRIFQNVLTIGTPTQAAEITGFSITKA